MITNIIKNLIKDIPSVANSTISLIYNNKENNEFAVNLGDKVTFVVNEVPRGAAHSVEEWKLSMIADHIFMAASRDLEPITVQQLSDVIDKIISDDVVLWNMTGPNMD